MSCIHRLFHSISRASLAAAIMLTSGAVLSATAAGRPVIATVTADTEPKATTIPASDPERLVHVSGAPLGQGYVREVEPNDSPGTATPLGGTNIAAIGNSYPPVTDVDFYSFMAIAGDRVYAATMTSFSASNENVTLSIADSVLDLLASDGITVIESDDDNGMLTLGASSLAGTVVPTTGTYFLRVRVGNGGVGHLRPYELHFRLQSGAPAVETEPNDTQGTANALPVNGWVSGKRDPALATEQDWYSFTANAGDTVFLSLDLDPERDNIQWDGRLGIGHLAMPLTRF